MVAMVRSWHGEYHCRGCFRLFLMISSFLYEPPFKGSPTKSLSSKGVENDRKKLGMTALVFLKQIK